MRLFCGLMGVVLLAAVPAAGGELTDLRNDLDRVADSFHGVLGYSIRQMRTGRVISKRGDEMFPSASTIKVAILCAAFEKVTAGEIDYDAVRELREEDRQYGTGLLHNFRTGSKVSLRNLLHLMITQSDNTAAIMVGQWLGSATINDWLRRHGFAKTRLLVPFPYSGRFDEAASGGGAAWEGVKTWGIGVTTPDEMRRLFELILAGQAGTAAACDEMQRILSHQYYDDGIASQVPPAVAVASKHGSEDASRSDAAIVHAPSGDYVLTIYTRNASDTRVKWDNEQDEAIRRISRRTWQYFERKSQWAPPGGVTRFYLFQVEPCYPGMPCWTGAKRP